MSNLATLQRAYDNELPDDEFYEPDTVGDPAQEIRDGFAAKGEVPCIDHSRQREKGYPASMALMDVLGDHPEWADDLLAALYGDQLAAHRIKTGLVTAWISQEEDDLRMHRRGELFADDDNRIPSEAC